MAQNQLVERVGRVLARASLERIVGGFTTNRQAPTPNFEGLSAETTPQGFVYSIGCPAFIVRTAFARARTDNSDSQSQGMLATYEILIARFSSEEGRWVIGEKVRCTRWFVVAGTIRALRHQSVQCARK